MEHAWREPFGQSVGFVAWGKVITTLGRFGASVFATVGGSVLPKSADLAQLLFAAVTSEPDARSDCFCEPVTLLFNQHVCCSCPCTTACVQY